MAQELNIGMAFSGGGYRAAAYDLGTLSFLNTIRLEDGRTLLDCVSVLTSVSGGTIPALKYMLACAKGQPVDEMIRELFNFLCNDDLITPALESISAEKANRDASSIKIMADVYGQCLFGGATMGDIIDKIDQIPVKDYTALATDFDRSLPFRFRIAANKTAKDERMAYCFFGNGKNTIGQNVVSHITLGETMACSSCFPSGFEPMMFPDDFQVSQNPEVLRKNKRKFGLMDGGLVDNQGIDPILLAEERRYKAREDKTRTDKALDLVIISDVADSEIEDRYTPCNQLLPKFLGNLTMGRLRNYGLISEVVVVALFILALVLGNNFWLGVMTVVMIIVSLANVAGALLKNKLFSAIEKTFVGKRARFISHLKFASAEAMLMNRAKSLIIMTSEVFINRLRQMNYSSIYSDSDWKNRIISSNIYELRPDKKWERRRSEGKPEVMALIPSEAVQQNSDLAASMGTTIWFTDEHKAAGMPQALLATGQYNICRNLLGYIYRIEKDRTNTTSAHDLIIACKPQLEAAWKCFQENPQWMVPEV